MTMQRGRRVAVYCGSSPGDDPRYMRTARELGYQIASAGIGIVYGGGQVGLMGALIEGSLAGKGDILGVIPAFLLKKERTHDDARSEVRIVSSMHERKAAYYDLAGAFLVLPGGLGTFEELFETLAWAHLGLVHGPIILFNETSYFDPLIALLDRSVASAFVSPRQRDLIQVVNSIDEVLAVLRKAFSSDVV